jgi:hypothetical protein
MSASVVKLALWCISDLIGGRVHRRAPTSSPGIRRFVDLAQLVARATHGLGGKSERGVGQLGNGERRAH